MDDYISREAVKEKLRPAVNDPDSVDFWEWQCSEIDSIPAADVRRVIRSKWKYIEYYPEGHDYKCQKCRFKNAEPTNYCPSCGAVMMGVDT